MRGRYHLLNLKRRSFIDMQKSNTDMQFSHWNEYLVKVACAVFKLDPSDIGFSPKERTNVL